MVELEEETAISAILLTAAALGLLLPPCLLPHPTSSKLGGEVGRILEEGVFYSQNPLHPASLEEAATADEVRQ